MREKNRDPWQCLTNNTNYTIHVLYYTSMSFIILLACLMFATFCFQHISLHIQAPKKDPDYEDEDSDVGLFAFFTTILETPKSRVLTFHTFEKATFMV